MLRSSLPLTALALGLGSPVSAQWSTVLGANDSRNGAVTAVGPRDAIVGWSRGEVNQWVVQPLTDGERVYASHSIRLGDAQSSELRAYSLDRGQLLWSVVLPAGGAGSPWLARPLALRDGRLYATRAGGPSGPDRLYALDAASGALLWQSEASIDLHFATSPVFAPDGDVIVNGAFDPSISAHRLVRIDAADGSTVWSTPHGTSPEVGGGVVHEGRYYRIRVRPEGPRVARFDLDSGQWLYQSSILEPKAAARMELMVGRDGAIYWSQIDEGQPANSRLVALDDNGAGFAPRWSVPVAALVHSSLAEFPDGSILSYSQDFALVKLDASSGEELARGQSGVPFRFARAAIDSAGQVFVTLGTPNLPTPQRLIALDGSLEVLWARSIPPVTPSGGPTLASDGSLVLATGAPALTVYVEPSSCGGESYCEAGANSVGAGAHIDFLGSTSIAKDDLVLRVDGLPSQQLGLFYYGEGATAEPFGNGVRCIASPSYRLGVWPSDASGAAYRALDYDAPPAPGARIEPGSTWRFQYWYRDPQGGGSGFNLSDGLSLVFCP